MEGRMETDTEYVQRSRDIIESVFGGRLPTQQDFDEALGSWDDWQVPEEWD